MPGSAVERDRVGMECVLGAGDKRLLLSLHTGTTVTWGTDFGSQNWVRYSSSEKQPVLCSSCYLSCTAGGRTPACFLGSELKASTALQAACAGLSQLE